MTWTLLVLFALIIIIVIAVKYSSKTIESTAIKGDGGIKKRTNWSKLNPAVPFYSV
jgi:hypothetical protein